MDSKAKKTARKAPAGKKADTATKATRKPQPGEKVVPVRCQPRTYPCPTCGQHGHRRHRYDRFVRSLAYGQVLWLHVFYAEYSARCHCRKYYRSCPANVPTSAPRPTTTTCAMPSNGPAPTRKTSACGRRRSPAISPGRSRRPR